MYMYIHCKNILQDYDVISQYLSNMVLQIK